MKTFIGIDVSLESSAVCVLDEHGQVFKRAQIASEPESLVGLIKGLPWQVEAVGMKAEPLSQWLQAGLTKADIGLTPMETRQVKPVLNTRSH